MIIGLGYQAQSGKDTVGDYLVEAYGFKKVAFAHKLKHAAAVIFGLTHAQLYGHLKEVEDPYWQDTSRNIMQKLGKSLRDGYRDDVWIKALVRKLSGDQGHVVITDVRYPNEAKTVRDLGGVIWRVHRPDLPAIATPDHESEVALASFKGWDVVLENDSTIGVLYQRVDELMEQYRVPNLG